MRNFAKTNKKVCLIKFGEYEHMRELYEEGCLFFNTFTFFKDMEVSSDGRADKNEYASAHYAGEAISNIKLEIVPIDNPNLRISAKGNQDFKAITLNFDNDKQYTHLYSLSYIDFDWALENDTIIDERNFAPKKDYAVFINNPDEFLNRVEAELKKLPNYNYLFNSVEYVEKFGYFGKMGAFKKFNDFSYQNEFRIANWFSNNQPQSIYIGSLKDIATKPLNKYEFYNINMSYTYRDYEDNLTIAKITNKKILDKLNQ